MGFLSSLIGGAGGSSKTSTASGYTTLPEFAKDFSEDELFPLIKLVTGSPYQGIPLRRINESDTDPVFGSKARQGIQTYLDTLASMRGQEPTATAAAPSPSLEMETDPVTGQTYIKGMRSGNKFSPGYYSNEQAASLGQQGISAPQSGLIMAMLKQMMGGK